MSADAELLEEPLLYVQSETEEPELRALAGGVAAVYSAGAPDRASPNEDSVALIPIDPGSAVLAVADGLGGPPGGEQASARALRCLGEALQAGARGPSLLRDAILNGFERADRGVRELGGGAGTTLAVVEIQEDLVRAYHVGDSSILAVGQRGRIKLQTVLHSPVGFAVESGLLDEEEALHHEERHVVSNVLGGGDMRIELGPVLHLAPRDTLLLASDGLVDNLHTAEIAARIRRGPLRGAARQLAREARARMLRTDGAGPSKPDDLSFVLFRRSP